jgi:predicted dehydrogenase
MERMKTAVFGCGIISDIYIANMQKFEVLDVVCCAATTLDHAQAKAEQYGLEARTVDEILADDSIELIVNLTPPKAHYDLIKRALLAGKHVFTEKVLASNIEEARELIKLADEKRLYLGCAPETFMGGAVQAARKAIQAGAIGIITGCHASVNLNTDLMYPIFRSLAQEGAGIGMDRGIYFLTALCSIMGPVAEVCGFVRTLDPIRTIHPTRQPEVDELIEIKNENQLVAAIRFAGGALGTLNFNGNCILPEEPELIIQGKKGILHLPDSNGFGGKVTLLKSGQWRDPPVYEDVEYDSDYVTDSRGMGPAELAYAVRKGEPNRASKEMAFHMMEVFDGIERSDTEKRSIRIDSRFALPEGLERLGE